MDIIKDLVRWCAELDIPGDTRAMLRWLTVPAGVAAGWLPFVWVFLFTSMSAMKAPEAPWWERARAIFAIRSSAGSTLGLAMLPALMVLAGGWRYSSGAAIASAVGMGLVSWLTAGITARWLDDHLVRKPFVLHRTVAALGPSLLLYGALMTIFITATFAGGKEWNLRLVVAVAGGLLACQVWLYHVLPRVLRWLTDDPPQWIAEAVQAAAPPGSIPPPIRILRSDAVNAFAVIRHGWIGFTRGAVAHLTPEEITCIARHEMAHLSEPASEVRRRQRGLLVFVPLFLISPLIATFGFVVGLIIACASSRIIGHLLSGHSRRMEARADAAGAGDDAATYARTLQRIYELNVVPVVIGMSGQSHPDLYDRMLAAGVQPDYPRPPAPSRMAARAANLAGFITMLIAGILWALFLDIRHW